MKTITESPYIFSFIPLIYPEISDVLTIDLRNEISNLAINSTSTWLLDLGRVYLTISSPQIDFIIGNKYSFVIKNGIIPIYYGKLIVLETGTDIQNYTYGNSYFIE
jgi:hypothetical protein